MVRTRVRTRHFVCAVFCASVLVASAACSGAKASGSPTPTPTPGACAAGMPIDTLVDVASAPEVLASGEDAINAGGAGDASIWYPAGAPSGVLTYTHTTFAGAGTNAYLSLSTHAATSSDGGASWAKIADVNAPVARSITTTDASLCPGGAAPCTISGWLVHETSSIVDDAADPDPSARFKLLVHSYMELPAAAGGSLRFEFPLGYVGMQTAPDPSGPWSAEKKLFGWNGSSAISSSGAQVNLSSIAGMQDCFMAGEPGAVVTSNGLDVAIVCARVVSGAFHQDIELMRSPDHGASWSHVAQVLPGTLASSMCGVGDSFSGGDLFTAGGQEYLSVVTGAPLPQEPNAYNACLVFHVADPATGALETDGNGRPKPIRRLTAPPEQQRFSGPCTYAEGASADGYVITEHFLEDARFVRNLASGTAAP